MVVTVGSPVIIDELLASHETSIDPLTKVAAVNDIVVSSGLNCRVDNGHKGLGVSRSAYAIILGALLDEAVKHSKVSAELILRRLPLVNINKMLSRGRELEAMRALGTVEYQLSRKWN